MKHIGMFLPLVFVMGCQIKPTQTFQTSTSLKGKSETIQAIIQQDPVILDVRSPYDFNLSKVPGSVSVQWQDFSDSTPGYRGYIQKDRAALARRLALVGVHPDRPVLVIGYAAPRSLGEEGRVAWMLRSLGVKKVRTLKEGELKALNPREEKSPRNASYWDPQSQFDGNLDRSLFKALVQKEEPVARIMTKARSKALQHPRIPSGPLRLEKLKNLSIQDVRNDFVLIDARPDFKFQQEPLAKVFTLLKSPINLDWKKMYQTDGQVRVEYSDELLKSLKSLKTPIIIFGDYGLESAAMAFALTEMGFEAVFHYEGGYEELRIKN